MYTKTFETVVKYRVLPGIALLLGLSPNNASAAITQERASANLTYKYDFDIDPRNMDLDGNGYPDLGPSTNGPLISDGKLVPNTDTTASQQALSSTFLYNGFFQRNTNLWASGINSYSQPWTIEFKVKLNSTTATGDSWFNVNADHSTSGGQGSQFLELRTDSMVASWNSTIQRREFLFDAYADNTIRIAYGGTQAPGYYYWLNGVLLNNSLEASSAITNSSDWASGSEALSLGNFGPNDSRWEMDYLYLDFTGAYAPPSEAIPEPASASLAGLGLAMLLLRRRRARS